MDWGWVDSEQAGLHDLLRVLLQYLALPSAKNSWGPSLFIIGYDLAKQLTYGDQFLVGTNMI